MDPLFLLALEQQTPPPEIRIIPQKAPAKPPGFTVTPQTPMPQIPPKSGVPLNPDVQKAMKAILPIITEDADPPAVSDIAAARSERYRNYMSEGIDSVPERIWEDSAGTMTVIDRAVKPDGSYVYYGLTAGHTMIQSANAKPVAEDPRSVMTPGGKLSNLRFIGLVEDKNDPAYRGRDIALVAFESREEISLARRATVVPGKIDKGKDYFVSGFPNELASLGDNGVSYGQDFVQDRNVTIEAPRIVKGDAQKETIPTDIVTQKITDNVKIVSGSYPSDFNQAPDGSFDDDPLTIGNARTQFNPSGRIAYNDANTHTGHSGAPILNDKGEIVAVHNAAEPGPDGWRMRGPGLAVGSYLDARTNNIIDQMVNSDIALNNNRRPTVQSLPNVNVGSWRERNNNLTPLAPQNPQQNPPGRRPG